MGISVFILKLIALCSMILDHLGVFLYPRFASYSLARLFRVVGRIAFPVYAFLIVNGYEKTRDVTRYLTRLCTLALISQLPFVLTFEPAPVAGAGFSFSLTGPWPAGELILIAFVAAVWFLTVRRDASVLLPVLALLAGISRLSVGHVLLLTSDLNVFYTLALGLACVSILDRAMKPDRQLLPLLWQTTALAAAFLLIRGTADYRYLGVALIVSLSLCRDRRSSQALLIVMWAAVEYLIGLMRVDYFVSASLAAGLILLYHGEHGRPLKRLFYWSYPAHLLLLGLLNVWYSLGA